MKTQVTKTFLPSRHEFDRLLDRVWESHQLTNLGSLHDELEFKLRSFLNTPHLLLCTNGTTALQLAIRASQCQGEIITTPFSYVATTNAILWEGCTPVFVDIDEETLCIDPTKIESAISERTSAILSVHVYGNSCEVDRIESIAQKHKLAQIYDAAHSFGSTINGRSLATFGDCSTLSFHATKLFHTAEGGAVITPHETLNETLFNLRIFGHRAENYFGLGINAKLSELHAAMGLAVLPYIPSHLDHRKLIHQSYDNILFPNQNMRKPRLHPELSYNHAYYPLVFDNEMITENVVEHLGKHDIFPRRYFRPALNDLPHFQGQSCPIAESIVDRVLCLPLHSTMETRQAEIIAKLVRQIV